MTNATQNKAVQNACLRRVTKLENERRFYQIIQERHRIQSMMFATRVESVRGACNERLKQLVLELEYLRMEDDDASEDYDEPVFTASACATDDDRDASQEDGRWYDRVLTYVNNGAEKVMHDEMSLARRQAHHQNPARREDRHNFSTDVHHEVARAATSRSPCVSLDNCFS